MPCLCNACAWHNLRQNSVAIMAEDFKHVKWTFKLRSKQRSSEAVRSALSGSDCRADSSVLGQKFPIAEIGKWWNSAGRSLQINSLNVRQMFHFIDFSGASMNFMNDHAADYIQDQIEGIVSQRRV